MKMKPLIKCPSCHDDLIKNEMANGRWWEESCPNKCGIHDCKTCKKLCKIDYRQYYSFSFNEEYLSWIRFYTNNYIVYSYFEGSSYYPNQTHFYHIIYPDGKSHQLPIAHLYNLKIDLSKLDELDTKLNLYTKFI